MSSLPRPMTPRRGRHSRSSSLTTSNINNAPPSATAVIVPSPSSNAGDALLNDPFVQLEDETEKSLHLLAQLRDRHRAIVASLPEVNDKTRFRSAQQQSVPGSGGLTPSTSTLSSLSATTTTPTTGATTTATTSQSSTGIKPASIDWHSSPITALIELDDVTQRTDELINDVTEDLTLLKATVQKHVDGAIDVAYVNLDSDEVARRVEIVHAFERKLRLARNELQNMIKSRDYRQMQLGDYATAYQEEQEKLRQQQAAAAAAAASQGTPLRFFGRGGGGNTVSAKSPSPAIQAARQNDENSNNNNNNPNRNDFAANYIRQEMEEQNKISAQHAVILDQIHVGVMSAEDKAKLINQSLRESEQKLGFVDKQIDGIQNRLESAIQATNKLLVSVSERNKMILVCVLTVILVLLLFGLFSGNGASSS